MIKSKHAKSARLCACVNTYMQVWENPKNKEGRETETVEGKEEDWGEEGLG